MPEVIDKKMPIVLGSCVRVKNAEGNPGVLVCIQVESNDGRDEYCILLTEDELRKLPRLIADFDDIVVAGRIYVKFINGSNYYCVKLKDWNGTEFIAAFDIGFWRKCFERAAANPDSCTKKGIITDLLD